ncbi:hypothetical protein BJF93_03480 [Xaviernesmea oryzae]|uniref:O-GlcNAc transferase C-terminal domain-containing protein n=1 Tax=Xaviernesmea oryzae TaxID=464029 RepID=A0A1Q9AZK0_9HYPH|nr:hypothetical protein [Xaviernesmea oryzae]OLP61121.1 hypothetical protein BJF93_03480 [Xaviernesmea oryzae]SEL12566.1 Glycosyl transferase family 41 [Xaviernesmea oryzae]
MSASFAKALQRYKADDVSGAIAALKPMLQPKRIPLEVLLLAGQCFTKAEHWREAASYYSRAADLHAANAPMLRALAANLLARTDDSYEAMQTARKAARNGVFDADAEDIYRRNLQDFVCLDEAQVENERFLAGLKAGDEKLLGVEYPFMNINWCDDESINARMTNTKLKIPLTAQARAARRARPHAFQDRLRIGYLSCDFYSQHATMLLFRGVLDLHDPEQVDVTLFCYTNPKNTVLDDGWRGQQPKLIDIHTLSDEQAVARIREEEIDILVDLKGHTRGGRGDILNIGAAPIQVAYLGFPGSGVGIDCDYIIGDPIVLPESSKPYYHEKFCRLPESYQANDRLHRPDPPATSRASLGLPEGAFVFASFNAVRKVTPRTAALWARILLSVPNSVLWILCAGDFARDNLASWMEGKGVARSRILFAPFAHYPEHIARLKVADFGLDTFPVNGHTTSSDKLWAGLPLATIKGRHFASRVSESLLAAVGLSELVAEDDDAYVDLVVSLAKDRERLSALRHHLSKVRAEAPLFDTARFTRHLEKAYRMMAERAQTGQEPDHFDVPALDHGA